MKAKHEISDDQARRLYNSLRELTDVFAKGENYTTQNPYSRREVKQAMEIIAEIQGKSDWLSASL